MFYYKYNFMYLHIFFFVNSIYICTFAVQNNYNMFIYTVKNPANPARSTERNGIIFNVVVILQLAGWFFNFSKKCRITTKTKTKFLQI